MTSSYAQAHPRHYQHLPEEIREFCRLPVSVQVYELARAVLVVDASASCTLPNAANSRNWYMVAKTSGNSLLSKRASASVGEIQMPSLVSRRS